jgi:hypothetical protein
MKYFCAILFALSTFGFCTCAFGQQIRLTPGVYAEAPRLPHDPWQYSIDSIDGWTVHTNISLKGSDTVAILKRLLTRQLDTVVKIFPVPTLQLLRRSQIWIERNGDFGGMTYHFSPAWLQEHGYNPEMAPGIELTDPGAFVSEQENGTAQFYLFLMTGYAFQIIQSGDRTIFEAFQHMLQTDLYKQVVSECGRASYGIARNSAWDYFAVLSSSYLNRGTAYPFDRKSLSQYDPRGYRVVSNILGERRKIKAHQQ